MVAALGACFVAKIPTAAQPTPSDRVTIRIIVVGTNDEATHVVKPCEWGKFCALAREVSLDPSAEDGAAFSQLSPSQLRSELRAALEGLALGAVSPIVEIPTGFAVLMIVPPDNGTANRGGLGLALDAAGDVKYTLSVGGFTEAELALGQPVPDFRLVNQVQQPVSLSQLRGSVVVINIVYTRCVLPAFCLRVSSNFAALSRRFKADLSRGLTLLTVTFDPVRDQPDVLKRYADQWASDPRTWHFLTGEVSDVQRVCRWITGPADRTATSTLPTLTTASRRTAPRRSPSSSS